MGIEQETHGYVFQASSSSAGSGSKKPRSVRARPRIAPNCRFGGEPWAGTRRTTGVLPRMMMTSSPAVAFAMRRDKLVLAAWIECDLGTE